MLIDHIRMYVQNNFREINHNPRAAACNTSLSAIVSLISLLLIAEISKAINEGQRTYYRVANTNQLGLDLPNGSFL